MKHNYSIEQVLVLLGSAVVEGEIMDELNTALATENLALKRRIQELEATHDDSDAPEAPAVPTG